MPNFLMMDEYFTHPIDPLKSLAEQTKAMDYYQILQKNKDFFKNFDAVLFDTHLKALRLRYSPSRYFKNLEKASVVLRLVNEAAEVMQDSQKRAAYLKQSSTFEEITKEGISSVK